MNLLSLLFAPILFNNVALGLSTCWYPDGSTSEPGHVPCNQTTNTASTCCSPQDGCSGGFCVGIAGAYRGSCTDQSWNSPNCGGRESSQCITDPSTRRRYNRATAILTCSEPGVQGPSVCCGGGNGSSSCCNEQFRIGNSPVYSPGLDVLVSDTNSLGASNTTNITNVPSSPGQDIGTKIGLGIGIPLSVFALGILAFLFYREHKKSTVGEGNTATMGLVNTANQQTPMEQQNLYPSYSNSQSYPTAVATTHHSYSPPSPKPDPIYEAPVSNVHEMRG